MIGANFRGPILAMNSNPKTRAFQDKMFLVLLVLVSVAFCWILKPFYSAVLWAIILATVFVPVQRWVGSRLPERPNLTALITLLVIVGIVLIPLAFTAGTIVSEATSLYDRLQSGELNLGGFLQRFLNALPSWATNLLSRLGVSDVADIITGLHGHVPMLQHFIIHGCLIAVVDLLHHSQSFV